MHQEYAALSKSLGFIFVPREEIENRLIRLKHQMDEKGIQAILLFHKMDFYYLSGTAQNSILFIPLEGKPLLMVKRELERARLESPLDDVIGIKSLRELPSLIQEHRGRLPETIGLEMDILPVNDYFRIKDLFPTIRFVDAFPIIKDVRKIKSPFEISLMRKAGEIGAKVYEEGRKILRAGMTELEFGGLLEIVAKRQGHEGILRTRSLNFEAYTWHILSGPSGSIVSQTDSPMGGLGLSPAFSVGASLRAMNANDPILVDFGTCYHGYLADETRMFSIGKMASKFLDAYQACKEIYDAVLLQVKPGAECGTIFQSTLKIAEKLGYKDYYLGPPGLQTRFVGHGIGLELSEFPLLAQGQHYPIEEGMALAIEPKMVFPGEGSVGLENTMLINRNGYELLTPLSLEIIEV